MIDPRLLRYARATQAFIVASIGLGLLSTLLIIGQAWLLAYAVSATVSGSDLAQLETALLLLLGVILARALAAWGAELVAHRSSIRAKRQLRSRLVGHLAAVGPGSSGMSAGGLATLAGHGLDALDAYFSLYLPQLVLAVIAPVAVLVAVFAYDPISGAIIVFTLPLIPIFMALVGATTRDRTEVQLRALQRLAGHFLDVVSGLTTLKVFGRAKAQREVIREISERQREAATATFRVTFLSSLVLELLATLSVALVAVTVGLRLLAGALSLRTALFVLVLAPEAYLPLRLLGANYHASAEGIGAARQVFGVLEMPRCHGGGGAIPDLRRTAITAEELTVCYPGHEAAALAPTSLRIEPGTVLALTGPSGAGKSTLLSVLLGLVAPTSGAVFIGDRELQELSAPAWRQQIAWLPQRPHLFAGTIEDNIRLANPEATHQQVMAAVHAAGLGPVVASRAEGLRTKLGDLGSGISVGERQRVALARAFLREAPLLLLDEPTANLDGATEQEVLAAIRRLMQDRTVIVVAHRPALVALADEVIEMGRVRVPA